MKLGMITGVSACLVSCSSVSNSFSNFKPRLSSANQADINTQTKFSSKSYGVQASPRLTVSKNIKTGGGRYHVGKPYKIAGKWYHPKEDPNYNKVGIASWYGPNFHGRLTANGEIFDQNAISAAHPTLPLPSYVRVTNQKNGRSVLVRVNDRGPFAHGRMIDLSKRTAEILGVIEDGTASVRVKYIGRARMDGKDQFLAQTFVQSPSKAIYDHDRKVVAKMTGQTPSLGSGFLTGSINTDSKEPLYKTSTDYGLDDISVPKSRPIMPSSFIKPVNLDKVQLQKEIAAALKPQAYAAIDKGVKGLDNFQNSGKFHYHAGRYVEKADAELIAAALYSYGEVKLLSVETDAEQKKHWSVLVTNISTAAHVEAVDAKVKVLTR